MNAELKAFIGSNYPKTKSDLFASFMERIPEMTKKDGYMGYVTPYVWMFIQSHKWLREYILHNTTITNLVQLEYNAFGPAVIPVCSFTLKNLNTREYGNYIKLSEFRGVENQPIKALEAIHSNVDYLYKTKQSNFSRIPDNPIAYWVSDRVNEIFEKSENLGVVSEPKQGMATADNDRFLRYWNEIQFKKIGLNFFNREDAKESKLKWFPYNKGGEFRKWYGNQEYLVNWENDGEELFNFKPKSVLRNPNFYV